MARRIYNARIDRCVNDYRCFVGNRRVFKTQIGPLMLKVLKSRNNRDSGDQNTMRKKRRFVDFFGKWLAPRPESRACFADRCGGRAGIRDLGCASRNIDCAFGAAVELCERAIWECDVFENTKNSRGVEEISGSILNSGVVHGGIPAAGEPPYTISGEC